MLRCNLAKLVDMFIGAELGRRDAGRSLFGEQAEDFDAGGTSG